MIASRTSSRSSSGTPLGRGKTPSVLSTTFAKVDPPTSIRRLRSALGMIRDDSRPSYVLFLTDGLPTSGETEELRIADNTRHANSGQARLFCFGVGFDVNARLLDRLSGGNSGTSEYVKPDEDIEAHVGRFYRR